MSSVRIEFYGVLREATGEDALNWPLESAVSVAELMSVLTGRYAALQDHLARIACAVNDEISPRARLLRPGDTLALLPPVSGG